MLFLDRTSSRNWLQVVVSLAEVVEYTPHFYTSFGKREKELSIAVKFAL